MIIKYLENNSLIESLIVGSEYFYYLLARFFMNFFKYFDLQTYSYRERQENIY